MKDLLQKIKRRIKEDVSDMAADFSQEMAQQSAPNTELIERFFIERLEIHAHWYMFLVPSVITVEDFVEALETTFRQEAVDLLQKFAFMNPHRLDLRVSGCVSRWKARAIKRERELQPQAGTVDVNQIPKAQRLLIGRWMKDKDLKNETAARELGISKTVLAALKRGAALKEKRCGVATVVRVAQKIGCQASDLDANYDEFNTK